MQQQRVWEGVVALVAVFLGLAAWYLSGNLPPGQGGTPGPAFFPRILAGILVLGGLALLAAVGRQGGFRPVRAPSMGSFWRMGLLWGALWLVPWLLPKLGLVLTAVVYSMLTAALLGARWSEVLSLGVVVGVLVQLVFAELLKVR
ncbi:MULTISPECIES: tripartite tricarboxylate transporter TctB family protein [unclassified Meiothermus]|uniref:tripartite tricarboxylate transporter TctB family protein n=1 Tax=unclassified Meiothermus TaxID=370471 RepID=UPI000D7C0FCC|nr:MULTISPECIES: tripartite tricarboxylate transporter TctB family protein [unclassified Meiothermus]PZA06206.1 tripartite tricarboxylate transporter TctB family protein [Meiothermus sp. Pnk-1]RYM37459.1 tripartite tricarboxylate transporter TctB family protein [Meiothermus sp. PNK-Is4]